MQSATTPEDLAGSRPNVLLILVDDLGYSDIEPFGSEILTPNLSRLAGDGARFTNFHTAVKCNPSRAMLLTGLDNNLAASGPRTNYQIRRDVPTIAERLGEAGYHTYLAGKWDAGMDAGELPSDRGFERSFAMLPGAGLHFRSPFGFDTREDGTTLGYLADGERVILPEDYHSTEFFTHRIMDFVRSNIGSDQPFFAFLSLTAPHYPLQAPAQDIAAFDGWYETGYEDTHRGRLERLRELGLFGEDHSAWSPEDLPDWQSMEESERAFESKRMQVYAAMVTGIDRAVGRMLEFLEEMNLTENTLVLFASDNGPDGTARGAGFREGYDNRTPNLGNPSSYVTQGRNWAQVSSTPYRLIKTYATEGGTRTPLIAYWKGVIAPGEVNHAWLRISDIAVTLLHLAGLQHHPRGPVYSSGRSALKTLLRQGSPYAPNDLRIHTHTEFRIGAASVLQKGWKLLWWKESRQYRLPLLFHLAEDPAETRNLAADHPEVVANLFRTWKGFAEQAGDHVLEATPAAYAADQQVGD